MLSQMWPGGHLENLSAIIQFVFELECLFCIVYVGIFYKSRNFALINIRYDCLVAILNTHISILFRGIFGLYCPSHARLFRPTTADRNIWILAKLNFCFLPN